MISRDLFVKAHDEREAIRKKDEERRMRELTSETESAFADLVGAKEWGDHVEVNGNKVTLWDGLVLRTCASSDVYAARFWAIEGKCPHCGETCFSQERKDLAGIGEMVVEFKPEFDHSCKVKRKVRVIDPDISQPINHWRYDTAKEEVGLRLDISGKTILSAFNDFKSGLTSYAHSEVKEPTKDGLHTVGFRFDICDGLSFYLYTDKIEPGNFVELEGENE